MVSVKIMQGDVLARLKELPDNSVPGLFPLAYGVPARVGRLRAYGNAIVPQVAAEFIGTVMDILNAGDR